MICPSFTCFAIRNSFVCETKVAYGVRRERHDRGRRGDIRASRSTRASPCRPTRLADGRELIYFDDADTALTRRARGRRAIARPAPRDRRDAAGPADRRVGLDRRGTAEPRRACRRRTSIRSRRRRPDNPSEIPSDYDVAVFENRSPSFGPALAEPGAPSALAVAARGRTRAHPHLGRPVRGRVLQPRARGIVRHPDRRRGRAP